jgi:hypothetical protein
VNLNSRIKSLEESFPTDAASTEARAKARRVEWERKCSLAMEGLSPEDEKEIIELAAQGPPPDSEEAKRMERRWDDWFSGKIL